MKTKLIYLVSDGKVISTTFEKPKGLRIGNKYWKQKFRERIGNAVSIYIDGPLVGVLGVYDLSKPEQVITFLKDLQEHTLSLADDRLCKEFHKLLGLEASSDVWGYKLAKSTYDQRDYKWTPLGKLLFDSEQVIHRICIQKR